MNVCIEVAKIKERGRSTSSYKIIFCPIKNEDPSHDLVNQILRKSGLHLHFHLMSFTHIPFCESHLSSILRNSIPRKETGPKGFVQINYDVHVCESGITCNLIISHTTTPTSE